jgi:hypothetical protein
MTWAEARMLAARDTKFRATLDALLAEKWPDREIHRVFL